VLPWEPWAASPPSREEPAISLSRVDLRSVALPQAAGLAVDRRGRAHGNGALYRSASPLADRPSPCQHFH
jgi:hypothetical protein